MAEKVELVQISASAKKYRTFKDVSNILQVDIPTNYTEYQNQLAAIIAKLNRGISNGVPIITDFALSTTDMLVGRLDGLSYGDGVLNVGNLSGLCNERFLKLINMVNEWYEYASAGKIEEANALQPEIDSLAKIFDDIFSKIKEVSSETKYSLGNHWHTDSGKCMNLDILNEAISDMEKMTQSLIKLRDNFTLVGNQTVSGGVLRNVVKLMRSETTELIYFINKCLKYYATSASQKFYAIEGKYAEYDYKTFDLGEDYKSYRSVVHANVSNAAATLNQGQIDEKARQAKELLEHNEELASLVHEVLNSGVKDVNAYSEYTWEQYARYYILEKEVGEKRPIAAKNQQEMQELIAWLKKESTDASSLGKSTESNSLVQAIKAIVSDKTINISDMINTIGLAAQSGTKVDNAFSDEQWKNYAKYYLYDSWNRKGWDMPDEGVITDELISETVKSLKEQYTLNGVEQDKDFADNNVPDNENFNT